jgi:hypothetical protein
MLTRIIFQGKIIDWEWENNRMIEFSILHFSLRIEELLEKAKFCIKVYNNKQPFVITIVF